MTLRFKEIKNIKAIPQLLALENKCFATDKLAQKQYRYFINVATTKVIAVFLANLLVASAIISFRKNSPTARIYSIAVHPDYRKLGMGKKFYRYIEKLVKKVNYQKIILEVRPDNLAAINFYLTHGFQEFGYYKKFYEDGSHALRMAKYLD